MVYCDLNACCAGRAGRVFVVGVSSSERYSKSSGVKFCASGSCLDMMYSVVECQQYAVQDGHVVSRVVVAV